MALSAGRVPVHSLDRNCPSHSTSWVFDISLVTRDQLEMGVADRLSSILPDVHSDVEPCRMEVTDQSFVQFVGDLVDCESLFVREQEVVRFVAQRNDEHVTWRERVSIREASGMIVVDECFASGDAVAKWAATRGRVHHGRVVSSLSSRPGLLRDARVF